MNPISTDFADNDAIHGETVCITSHVYQAWQSVANLITYIELHAQKYFPDYVEFDDHFNVVDLHWNNGTIWIYFHEWLGLDYVELFTWDKNSKSYHQLFSAPTGERTYARLMKLIGKHTR